MLKLYFPALVWILLKNDKVASVFAVIVFISLEKIFENIGNVKISRLGVVCLSRIKIHHTSIFFLLWFFFPCFFILFVLWLSQKYRRVRKFIKIFLLKKSDVGVGFAIYFMQSVEAAHVFFSKVIFFFSTMEMSFVFKKVLDVSPESPV